MKKLLVVLLISFAAFLFVSCGVSDDEEGETVVNDEDSSGSGGNGGG